MDPNHQRRANALPLTDVIGAMLAFEPQVMGIMHSGSSSMQAGLDELARHWSGPRMAYPESTNHHTVDPVTFTENCRAWVDSGVQVIGGCCGTTVEHIRTMVDELRPAASA